MTRKGTPLFIAGAAVLDECDHAGQKHGLGSLIFRMPVWVWGCANHRQER